MPPIYDDYGDDMYAILNNDNHEACHHDFNVQFLYANQVSHDSCFVEFIHDATKNYYERGIYASTEGNIP